MIFWKIKNLKNKLSSQKLENKESFYYLIAFVGIKLLEGYDQSLYDLYDYLVYTIWVITALLSLIVCYETNGSEKGNYFLERYISINFVMKIRYAVFFTIPSLIFDRLIQASNKFYLLFEIICAIFFYSKTVQNFQEIIDQSKKS